MAGLLLAASSLHADTTVKRLAPGVTLTQEIDQATPLVINVVSVDLDAPGVRIGVGIGQDHIAGGPDGKGREEVSHLARRAGALAAVNADYFPFTGDPLGVGIRDGELFSEPFTGIGTGGPRVTFGLSGAGNRVLFETLDFLGDLQAADQARTRLDGIDRVVNENETVVYTSRWGEATPLRPGGTEVVVPRANLPIRANKLITGRVQAINVGSVNPVSIPADGFVLSAAPGAGADFLARHVRPGDRIGFVLGVAPPGETVAAVRIANLPRTSDDLPSRAGQGISRAAFLWSQVRQAVGGGPRLLVHGQVAVDGAAEGFDASFTDHTHPRTAVGTTADGRRLLLVTVDGRQGLSKGVTLTDLALILRRYGAADAINLDGGGSTAMAVAGLTVDSPSGDGSERPVADMLLVYSDRPFVPVYRGEADPGDDPPVPDLSVSAPRKPLLVGAAAALTLRDGGRTVPGSSPDVLWQGTVTGGVGFVNQRGYFTAVKPGTGVAAAWYRGHLVTGPVTVVGPAPVAPVYTIHADFTTDPADPANRDQLTVRVLDQNGKPKPGAAVHVRVTGGVPDVPDTQTNADGDATVGITWNRDTGGAVVLTSGALKPVTVTRP